MIALQWFLVGGFPLRQSNRWWDEPGAFITANNFIAACIAIIPVIDGLARLPGLMAFVGWVWWLGLILWKIGFLAWQSTLDGQRRLSP
jgi:tellurite resistance protein TehA-like permease